MKLHNSHKHTLLRLLALLMVICLIPVASFAESGESEDDTWVKFLLMCNEGMANNGGNVGNTMMVVAMNWETDIIRMIIYTWDSFIDYEGYDVPQKIDMPYRVNGPEETMKVFNQNYDMGIDLFMSLNYANLASLINEYGGVTVDVSRAERNALNGMVSSKKDQIQFQSEVGFVNQLLIEMLAEDVYLNEYGPDTHLNGMQAIAFGWLQYDSVYNCCQRELKVISNLFASVAKSIEEKAIFYTNDSTSVPENDDVRRRINLDELTEEDIDFLQGLVSPIFQMSYNNLGEEDIRFLTIALAQNAYLAMRQGVDIFSHIDYKIFPLEALNEYDLVAGTYGHLVDAGANSAAMKEFLFNNDR